MVGRIFILAYGIVAYLVFFVTFNYMIGFVTGLVVPKTIDSGQPFEGPQAALINVLLLGLFAIQHTIMARPPFKRWFTRFIPEPMERSTFVLAASLLLILMVWQWRPLPSLIWDVQSPLLRQLLTGLSVAGFGLALCSSFLIDHFDLFGLRQVWLHFRGQKYHHHPFMERSLYRWIRHPLMAGFLIAFWAAPTMTSGHLLFSVVTTAYILFGIWIEEKTLLSLLGEDYRRYRERTPMLIPLRRPRPRPAGEAARVTS